MCTTQNTKCTLKAEQESILGHFLLGGEICRLFSSFRPSSVCND